MKKDSYGDDGRLIKGVNKQIVEIKCTNNEYFDRVLLFVNPRCNMYPGGSPENIARDYVSELTAQVSDDKKVTAYGKDKLLRITLAVMLSLLTAAVLIIALVVF